MSKDPALYVNHILESIENINADTEGIKDFEGLREDRRARQLVERNLEILSEASRNLPDELKELEPEIPWRQIAGIGSVLRHGYHRTNAEIIWETCKNDLKILRDAVERIRGELRQTGTVKN